VRVCECDLVAKHLNGRSFVFRCAGYQRLFIKGVCIHPQTGRHPGDGVLEPTVYLHLKIHVMLVECNQWLKECRNVTVGVAVGYYGSGCALA